MTTRTIKFLLLFGALLITPGYSQQRVKDIAAFKGVTSKRLIGYGLITGLDGTGDGRKSIFTTQAITNMLLRMGITTPSEQIRLKNVASVMVTANIPAFANKGMQLDVTISSLGDAKSLEGGVLLMTPLLGTDKLVYAYAQGPASIGGFNVQSGSGERIRKNYTLVGRVPGGGQLVRGLTPEILENNTIGIFLKNPDFTTAARLAKMINEKYNSPLATARNAGEVSISVPDEFQAPEKIVMFLSDLELLEVETDRVARIVINERTGTIVVGENVRVRPVAVAHGNLNVEIRSRPIVSQPGPFSSGETVVVPQTRTTVESEKGKVMVIENAANVKDIARALNALGVTPRDLIAIFQGLKQAGALNADLVIM